MTQGDEADDCIYHMAHVADWQRALAEGCYRGSPDDLRDGFIHCATGLQIRNSAAKHRQGQSDLLLIELDPTDLEDTLRWERSSSGKLFPHIYTTLDPALALRVRPLPLGTDGSHRFPDDVPGS